MYSFLNNKEINNNIAPLSRVDISINMATCLKSTSVILLKNVITDCLIFLIGFKFGQFVRLVNTVGLRYLKSFLYGHKSLAISFSPSESNFALLGLVVTRSQSKAPRHQ